MACLRLRQLVRELLLVKQLLVMPVKVVALLVTVTVDVIVFGVTRKRKIPF